MVIRDRNSPGMAHNCSWSICVSCVTKDRGFSIGGDHPYSGLKYDSSEFLAPEFLDSEIFWVDLKKPLNRHYSFWALICWGDFSVR